MCDYEDLAALAEWHLRLVFKANGQLPLKIEIRQADSSLNSVRATYRAWVYDSAEQDSGADTKATLNWEEGVAHFFRKGSDIWEGDTLHFVPDKDEVWEHSHNAVSDHGHADAESADLDQEVAAQWLKLKSLRPSGLKTNDLPA